MTPEQKAREEIDRQLAAAGWLVQSHKAMNILAGLGVAVREFQLKPDSPTTCFTWMARWQVWSR
jgi:hypothetical protein